MIELSVAKRWKKQRLSTLFAENSCKNQGCLKTHALQFFFGTIIPKKSYDLTEDLIRIYEKYIIVSPGDIVLNGLNLNYDFVSQRIGLVKENGIITSAYVILRPRKSVNYAYYCYLFKAMDAQKLFHGMGSGIRLTLSYKDLKNYFLPVPPREEQDQIVRFLDWKVSSINRLIALKKRQIANLNEMHLSVMNDLVTHGIVKERNYVKTSMDWACEIPAEWSISRIRNHFEILKRIAGAEGYDVFSVTQQGLRVRNVNVYEGQLAANYSGYQFVYPGEFAMNHMDLLTGGVGIADHLGVTSPDYRVFRIFDEAHCYAPYYLKVFQICYRRHAFYRFGRGAANVGRWRLPADAFRNFEIPLPPYEEQIKIVQAIGDEEQKTQTAIECLKKQIDLLNALKTRLISDTVTGKIDVRSIDIPEYEFVDEDTDADNEDGGEEEIQEQED